MRVLALMLPFIILVSCRTAAPESAGAPDTPLRSLAATRHILIGAAVDPQALRTEPRYAATLAREYDLVVAENAMKFDIIEPASGVYDFADADAIVNFATAHNMQIRGHNLVWHQQAGWIKYDWQRGILSPAQMFQALRTHILTVVGRYRGRIAFWDVVNEAVADNPDTESVSASLRETFWLDAWKKLHPDLPPYGYIEQAFRWAHEADPHAVLFYNDYGISGADGAKTDAVYNLLRQMKLDGVPVGGIGMQMHIDLSGYPLNDRFGQNIERFAALGLQVQITEADVRIPIPATAGDLKRQARTYHDILAACLAAKGSPVTAFLTWGFTDGHSWIPSFFPGYGAALPFDRDYRPKPAYFALQAALRN